MKQMCKLESCFLWRKQHCRLNICRYILVILTNTDLQNLVNSTNISTNIETAVLSTLIPLHPGSVYKQSFFADLNIFMNLVFIFRRGPDLWARATSAACIYQPTRKSATADQIAVDSQITNYDVFARLLFGIFGLVHHQHYAIRHKVRCSWRCFCHQSDFNFRPGTDTRLPPGCELQPKICTVISLPKVFPVLTPVMQTSVF